MTIKTLDPTWNEYEELMAHTMFQILRNYVEKDRGDNWLEGPNRDKRDKMDKLLEWWDNVYLVYEYPDRPKDELRAKHLRQLLDSYKKLQSVLHHKLIQIVELCPYLWS